MNLLEINWNPSDRQLRQFGGLCLLLIPLLGWFWNVEPQWLRVLLGSSIAIAALAWLAPRAIKPLFVGVIVLTAPIGLIVAELALLLIFFSVFLPISLAFRLMRRDALETRIDRTSNSYWQEKHVSEEPAHYFRRF